MYLIKNILRKFKTLVGFPKVLLIKALYINSSLFPDETYIRILFHLCLGYKLNLNSLKTYNEKLQRLKLNYINPKFPQLVDKYEAKLIVSEIISNEYIVPTYRVWDSFDEIKIEELPSEFVLKTTHDQGGVIVCKDKSNFDFEKAKEKLNRHLKKNVYYKFREWSYKYIKPRIIAESFLEDINRNDLTHYKFHCFDGTPEFVASGRFDQKDKVFDFYDMDLNNLYISRA